MSKGKFKNLHDTKALEKMRQAFSQRRQKHGRSYPQELKRLALDALDQGHSTTSIAQAAGIACQSVINWSLQEKAGLSSRQAVELKLVDETGLAHERQSKVRIRFCSGATLCLLISQLDARLISVLNGVQS